MSVIFVDTETTGLDAFNHELWEIAFIEEDGREHLWYRDPANLKVADPTALRINGFYERAREGTPLRVFASWAANDESKDRMLALTIAKLTAGKHLVGAVPSFDALFLDIFLRQNDVAPAWHYHTVDVEALAAGRLGIAPPWDSQKLSEMLGIGDMEGKHTALGDARWAKAMYEAALDRGSEPTDSEHFQRWAAGLKDIQPGGKVD